MMSPKLKFALVTTGQTALLTAGVVLFNVFALPSLAIMSSSIVTAVFVLAALTVINAKLLLSGKKNNYRPEYITNRYPFQLKQHKPTFEKVNLLDLDRIKVPASSSEMLDALTEAMDELTTDKINFEDFTIDNPAVIADSGHTYQEKSLKSAFHDLSNCSNKIFLCASNKLLETIIELFKNNKNTLLSESGQASEKFNCLQNIFNELGYVSKANTLSIYPEVQIQHSLASLRAGYAPNRTNRFTRVRFLQSDKAWTQKQRFAGGDTNCSPHKTESNPTYMNQGYVVDRQSNELLEVLFKAYKYYGMKSGLLNKPVNEQSTKTHHDKPLAAFSSLI